MSGLFAPQSDRDAKSRALSPQQARQAATPNYVRYVLAISLSLAVLAGAIQYAIFF